jgi:hypothetical protein
MLHMTIPWINAVPGYTRKCPYAAEEAAQTYQIERRGNQEDVHTGHIR